MLYKVYFKFCLSYSDQLLLIQIGPQVSQTGWNLYNIHSAQKKFQKLNPEPPGYRLNHDDNNKSQTLQPIEDHGLPTDCWLHFHLSAGRDERSSSQFRDDAWSPCRVSKLVLAFQTICRQSEKFLTQPITDVKIRTSGRWVETNTGAVVTATLV